jgi:hypothetical protein
MPLPSLQEIYEREKKRYESYIGKWVKIHTTDVDTVEGKFEDFTISMNEAEHQIAIWSVTLYNPKPKDVPRENLKPRRYVILAEIAVIEVVIEDEITQA